jgi:cysteine desulfuration protein SufE
MFTDCLEKQALLVKKFNQLPSAEAKYEELIEMGKTLPPLDPTFKTPENVVQGCQSILYLHTTLENGKLFFTASSEALISSGLAALLISIYDGQPPETLLKCPLSCIDELGIRASLTPGRSNGLASMHLRMRQDALKFLIAVRS